MSNGGGYRYGSSSIGGRREGSLLVSTTGEKGEKLDEGSGSGDEYKGLSSVPERDGAPGELRSRVGARFIGVVHSKQRSELALAQLEGGFVQRQEQRKQCPRAQRIGARLVCLQKVDEHLATATHVMSCGLPADRAPALKDY